MVDKLPVGLRLVIPRLPSRRAERWRTPQTGRRVIAIFLGDHTDSRCRSDSDIGSIEGGAYAASCDNVGKTGEKVFLVICYPTPMV